jgi:predicted alpha/beta-hydrolase family hydrolase
MTDLRSEAARPADCDLRAIILSVDKAPDLRVYRSDSARAACVVGHGAGAGQNSPFMVRFATGLAARGVTTATFDFPYMATGRKVPDKAPVLEASWFGAVAQARETFGALPLFIGGKSMGGRIASHIASQGCPGLAGVFFLGYPLHPPGAPDKRRDAHLPQIQEPMLFVQGTRDPFGTSDEIAALLPALHRATLHVVDDGDHSFKVRARATGLTADQVLDGIMDTVVSWMETGG